ncbi:hypothetical protein CY35_02G077200 [Sphagnum magellanicum]|nr:hypothetical protein CY35_02G077200 [Sphagnum magellanicum]
MVGRCMTSVIWGFLADKYGRKPVIIIGILSVIIFGTGFGFSTNFWVGLLMRFLLGGFNGILGTTKAYASEICNEKHQALGISVVGTCWGLGLIIGPAMGGYLSQPALKYPDLFPKGSLYDMFPYLLPSVCTSVFAVAVLIASFQLPETLHIHNKSLEEPKEEQPEVISEGAGEYPVLRALKLPERESQLAPENPSSARICQGIDSPILLSSPIKSFRSSFDQLTRTLSGRFSNNPSERGGTTADEENIQTSDHQVDEKDVVVAVLFTNNNNNNKIVNTRNEKDVPVEACKEENKIQMLGGGDDGFGHNKKTSLLSNWALMASIAVYCFWSLQDIAYTEIYSLWCVSPADEGGLGLTTTDVGQLLAASGFGMLVFQLSFFPVVVNTVGPILTTRCAALLSIPLLAVLPFYPQMHGTTLWVVLCLSSVVRFILSVTTLTASFLLVNNSVPQARRGVANGLSMSFGSFFKAVGPAGGGAIFSWAQSRHGATILPGNNLVFFFLGCVSFITALLTLEPFLPASTDHPFIEEF